MRNNVIIVGCQRSGTTALWRSLKLSPEFKIHNSRIHIDPETEKELWFINDFMNGRKNAKDAKYHGIEIDELYMHEYFEFVTRFLYENYSGENGRWLYAHPGDSFYIGELIKYMPDVQVIFMVRHPQELIWSNIHAPWEEINDRYNMLMRTREIARDWNKYSRIFEQQICGDNSDRIKLVRNEDIRKNPSETLHDICQYIQIELNSSMLDVLRQTHNSSFASDGEHADSIDEQREIMSQDMEFCRIVREETGRYMKYFNYECLSINPQQAHSSSRISEGDASHAALEIINKSHGGNENYWKNNLEWYECEVGRRRERMHSYDHQEIYLEEYFRIQSNEKKLKVLEYGSGFSRHLEYLFNNDRIDIYGCDISQQAYEAARKKFTQQWCDGHIRILNDDYLPYSDNEFDVVFTVSVLIHIKPDKLRSVLSELIRVCNGHILHIENPVTDTTQLDSTMHLGCWSHSLVSEYRALGYEVELLPEFSPRHSVYRVNMDRDKNPVYDNVSAHIAQKLKSLEILHDRTINKVESLNDQVDKLESQLGLSWDSWYHKLYRWLRSKPRLEHALGQIYYFTRKLYLRFIKKYPGVIVRERSFCCEFKDTDNNIVTICHPDWKGVRSAAEGQSVNRIYLSESGHHDITDLVELLSGYNFRIFIFNGYWSGYDRLMIKLKELSESNKILYVHHGSFYQMGENRNVPDVLAKIFSLSQSGTIDKIGFVKKGMAESFSDLGVKAWYVKNYLLIDRKPVLKKWKSPVKIGIPVQEHLRKNVHTQLIAALLLKDVDEIHLWHEPNLSYLKNAGVDLNRIIIHKNCDRMKTLDLMSEMTAIVYVTISECYPMVIIESLSVGTPCFSSNTHGILSEYPELERKLTINPSDNPVEIAEHISREVEEYDQLVDDLRRTYESLQEEARVSLENFVRF